MCFFFKTTVMANPYPDTFIRFPGLYRTWTHSNLNSTHSKGLWMCQVQFWLCPHSNRKDSSFPQFDVLFNSFLTHVLLVLDDNFPRKKRSGQDLRSSSNRTSFFAKKILLKKTRSCSFSCSIVLRLRRTCLRDHAQLQIKVWWTRSRCSGFFF